MNPISTVIRRELVERLESIQFAVLLVFAVVLFAVNSFVFVQKYETQLRWYSEKTNQTHQNPSTVQTRLFLTPGALAFLSEAGNKYRPSAYTLGPKGALEPVPEESGNFKIPDLAEIDWAFIVKIVFSLYVLLLGFDAVSGEKENGTLRLVLSNPLGRVQLLFAKYCGLMLTVSIPLLMGVLISLIVVGSIFPAVITTENILRVVLSVGLAYCYLSIFAFLSLLVSSAVHQSSLALLTLLSCWVLLAIIVPNTAGIVGDAFTTVPSEYKTAKQLGPMLQQQIWERINNVEARMGRGELKTQAEVIEECNRAFDEGQQQLVRYYESYYRAMNARAGLARSVSRFSPTALFQYATEDLAGTGTHAEEQFMDDANLYSSVYDRYVLGKTGKLVAQSRWSFTKNLYLDGKQFYISSPRPEEYEGDKSDFPRFVPSSPSIAQSVGNALFDFAGILLWNLVLAALSFRAILRSDVR